MQKTVYIFLSILISQLCYSNIDTLFKQANIHYKNNEFETAIEKYEQIALAGYESAEVYYNLGNAYFKTRVTGKAILNYERAKLLDPKNEDIQFNLDLANSYIVDKIEKIPVSPFKLWFNGLIRIFSSNNWAIISVVMFVLFLGFLLMYLFTGRISVKKISFWIAVLFIIISIISFGFSAQHKKLLTKRDFAIVMNPSVTAKSTPDNNSADLFVIHEGLKVKIEDKLGEWCEIKLSDGNKGWVEASAIGRI